MRSELEPVTPIITKTFHSAEEGEEALIFRPENAPNLASTQSLPKPKGVPDSAFAYRKYFRPINCRKTTSCPPGKRYVTALMFDTTDAPPQQHFLRDRVPESGILRSFMRRFRTASRDVGYRAQRCREAGPHVLLRKGGLDVNLGKRG